MNNANPIAIVQARMGSTRLPGKVLKTLAGKPALWHLIERLKISRYLNDIVIATTVNKEDDAIEEFCNKNSVKCFRGSAEDVLDRYYQSAKLFKADPISRITADCPALDPYILDEVFKLYFEGNYDICGLGGEFPDGLDCGCCSFQVIEDAWNNTELPSDREHVGATYLKSNQKGFKKGVLKKFNGMSHHRWTLDEKEDYLFLQEVFSRLYKPGKIFLAQDIFDLLDREPALMKINSDIIRDEGYIKSLEEDREYLLKTKDQRQ